MSTLKTHEKKIFEKLFDRNGYVLDFNDRTFSEFFREHDIDIDAQKYMFNGTSKMKRLRAFWEIEEDPLVGAVLGALVKCTEAIGKIDPGDKEKAESVICRLLGKTVVPKSEFQSEDTFLKAEFRKIDWNKLEIDQGLQDVLDQRINEINVGIKNNSPLSVVFLCGSTLEGILLDVAAKNTARFKSAQEAPKNRQIPEWTLCELIDVAHEVGFLSLDVKKHSHALRGFRNYIHPRRQILENFKPDGHTAKISWQVLQAAIDDLCNAR